MKTAKVFMSGGSQLTPKKRALDLFKEGIEGFYVYFVV